MRGVLNTGISAEEGFGENQCLLSRLYRLTFFLKQLMSIVG
jgi:hypothetical protein